MSQNNTSFAATLDDLTEEEMEWLRESLTTEDGDAPEWMDEADAEIFGCWPAFGWEIFPERRQILFDESGGEDAEAVEVLVQEFLRRFRPNDCWGMEMAFTCSKSRPGEIGGGAIFVTAKETNWINTGHWLAGQKDKFEKEQHGA